MERLEDVGKKHYRPPSYIKQSFQIENRDQIPTRLAARYLGVSAATLKRWELAGEIQASKTLGGHRLFVLAELDRIKGLMTSGKCLQKKPDSELEKLRNALEKAKPTIC